jgi:tyrosyl-tRNA synthetase
MIYPCMQCTDIFFLDVDICQLGIDQRKVNMLAIEMADPNKDKPIIVSHGMISGLIEGQEKMSKSNPDSAIFMEDSIEDVNRKIKKAFCPEKIINGNPILDYCKNIVFGYRNSIEILRSPQNGGNK